MYTVYELYYCRNNSIRRQCPITQCYDAIDQRQTVRPLIAVSPASSGVTKRSDWLIYGHCDNIDQWLSATSCMSLSTRA